MLFFSVAARTEAFHGLADGKSNFAIIIPMKSEMHLNQDATRISRERLVCGVTYHCIGNSYKLAFVTLMRLAWVFGPAHDLTDWLG